MYEWHDKFFPRPITTHWMRRLFEPGICDFFHADYQHEPEIGTESLTWLFSASSALN